MESKRAPSWLCLMLCLSVLNVGVDSKPLKQSDGDSHDLDIKESHRNRWDGWTEHVLKLHFKYMVVLDLIKEKMQKCTNYPNEMQCRPGRTKYLPNLADEDSGVLSFDLKEDVSGNYILQSAELYLHIVTSSPLSTSPHLLIVSHDTEQILRLSSNSENRSKSDLKIELDVTDEAMLFLEAGTAIRFNFTVDVSGDVTAVLILKLERVLAERPLVFDLLWPSKNVSGKGDAEHHHHHGSPSKRAVSQVTSQRVCRKHKVRVDFRELGYDWIISPHGFETSLCMGVCPFPLDSYLNATVHSTIQGFMNARDAQVEGARVPRPCCVPDAMSPIPLIIWDEEGDLTVAVYPEMVVESCGCR